MKRKSGETHDYFILEYREKLLRKLCSLFLISLTSATFQEATPGSQRRTSSKLDTLRASTFQVFFLNWRLTANYSLDEMALSATIKEAVMIRSKCYSLLLDDGKSVNKCKGKQNG